MIDFVDLFDVLDLFGMFVVDLEVDVGYIDHIVVVEDEKILDLFVLLYNFVLVYDNYSSYF